MNLLNLNLELNTADLSSVSDSVENNVYIKPKQLLFILNDINKKMEFLLLKTNDKLFEDDLLSESNVPGKISFNYFVYLFKKPKQHEC